MKEDLEILIVEDNPDNLEMLEYLLRGNHYKVNTAFNGNEALEKLQERKYDIIISDILMPEMDGFQLCRECKKNENHRNICFIFYTATYVDSKDEEFAMSLGAQNFIRKPQEPDVLLKIITETYQKNLETQDTANTIEEKDEKETYKLYSERLVAKLEKKNLDLENEIKRHKRSLELLQEAKQKAEESDRLKTAFLSNMNHEIRTPMNGIIGFTDLLKTADLDTENIKDYISIIQMSCNRLLSLITDLINISQIETGQITFNIMEFNVKEVIEQLDAYFRSEIERNGLELYMDFSLIENTPMLYSDKDKVETILVNLIKNAIKFTQKGSIQIGLKSINHMLEFYVKDTGIGIPARRLDAIFERFVQADIKDTRAFYGAGLGLSIAKSYANMLGGDLKVESEEEKGSTFYLTLPVQMPEKYKNQFDNLPLKKQNKNIQRKLKVLIAEDDEYSDIYLTLLLQKFSKEILHAKTGKEAVEICLDNKDIDLILLDIKMPVMDGYTALTKIREFNKKSVVIAQTAYRVTGDKENLKKSGCDDYINKPINETELTEVIWKHLVSQLSG